MKIDEPIEVTKEQYDYLRKVLQHTIVSRRDEETGQYFVKAWYPQDLHVIIKHLAQTQKVVSLPS